MQINEFSMQIKNMIVDPDEDDDRYVKDSGLFQQVVIFKNANYDSNAHPKFLISGNQEYFDKLFYLLSMENPTLIEPTWELLSKIPVSAKLQ